MTYEPYPQQPQPYPAGAQYPAGPPIGGLPPKPPVPSTVKNAFYLMLGGAALSLLGGVIGLAKAGSLRSTVHDKLVSQHPDFSKSQIDTATNLGVIIGIISAVVIALISVGLWVWMAYANRAGKNWARITGTVLFGIDTLFVLIGLAITAAGSSSTSSPLGTAMSVAGWVFGLAIVILLWRKQSGAYFKQQPVHAYPYPGQYPPAWGQEPGPSATPEPTPPAP